MTDQNRISRLAHTESYEVAIRNHKDSPVAVRVLEQLHGRMNWKIQEASMDWTKKGFQTILFEFELDANAERKITYTALYERY